MGQREDERGGGGQREGEVGKEDERGDREGDMKRKREKMMGTMARIQVITRYLHYLQAGGMKAHSTASTTSVQTSFLLCSEKKSYFTHIHVHDLSLPPLPQHTHTHTHTHT